MSWLRTVWLLGVFFLPATAWTQEACQQVVAVVVAQPPYAWVAEGEEKVQGAYSELAQALSTDLALEVRVLLEPDLAKARAEVASGRADILLADAVTLAGLQQFDYLYPALYERDLVAWVPDGQSFNYQGWNDLRGKRGVLLASQSLSPQFTQFAQANLSLQTVDTVDLALQAVQDGSAEFFIFDRSAGTAEFALKSEAARLRALSWSLFNEPLHVAVSHNSACNMANLRGQLAVQLHHYADQGVFYRHQQHALQAWLAEHAPVVDAEVQE